MSFGPIALERECCTAQPVAMGAGPGGGRIARIEQRLRAIEIGERPSGFVPIHVVSSERKINPRIARIDLECALVATVGAHRVTALVRVESFEHEPLARAVLIVAVGHRLRYARGRCRRRRDLRAPEPECGGSDQNVSRSHSKNPRSRRGAPRSVSRPNSCPSGQNVVGNVPARKYSVRCSGQPDSAMAPDGEISARSSEAGRGKAPRTVPPDSSSMKRRQTGSAPADPGSPTLRGSSKPI